MKKNIYRELQKRLDQYSMGFPETESGIEIKILKKLFSEEDAEIFLKISPMLEAAADIAPKIGMSEEKAGEKLEDMTKRGLLFRLRKHDKAYYGAIPFVHGLFEFQVKRLDTEMAEMVAPHGNFFLPEQCTIEGITGHQFPISHKSNRNIGSFIHYGKNSAICRHHGTDTGCLFMAPRPPGI